MSYSLNLLYIKMFLSHLSYSFVGKNNALSKCWQMRQCIEDGVYELHVYNFMYYWTMVVDVSSPICNGWVVYVCMKILWPYWIYFVRLKWHGYPKKIYFLQNVMFSLLWKIVIQIFILEIRMRKVFLNSKNWVLLAVVHFHLTHLIWFHPDVTQKYMKMTKDVIL